MGHGQVREQPQNEDGRDHEEGACHDAPQRPVQPPSDVGRDLLRLRTGQEHAEVERPQVLLLRNPTLPLDQLAVHDRDLASGTAEVDEPELHPEPESLPEADRLGLAGTILTHGGLGIHVISTTLVNNTNRGRVTTVTRHVKAYAPECEEDSRWFGLSGSGWAARRDCGRRCGDGPRPP